MSRSLSSVVDNLTEGLHNYVCTDCKIALITYQPKINCKYLTVENVAKIIKTPQ